MIIQSRSSHYILMTHNNTRWFSWCSATHGQGHSLRSTLRLRLSAISFALSHVTHHVYIVRFGCANDGARIGWRADETTFIKKNKTVCIHWNRTLVGYSYCVVWRSFEVSMWRDERDAYIRFIRCLLLTLWDKMKRLRSCVLCINVHIFRIPHTINLAGSLFVVGFVYCLFEK